MSSNDVILGVVALVLVVFSLLVSLVAPRRWPDFPGNRLGAFVLVAVLLVVAMLAAVEFLGESHAGGEGEEAAHVEEGAEDGAQQGAQTDTGAAPGGEAEGDPARGKEVFAEAGCGGCHVLEDAGATGTIGPNLDETKPSFDHAVEQVRDGGGEMPAFGDRLSEEDIRAVAAYVAEASQ